MCHIAMEALEGLCASPPPPSHDDLLGRRMQPRWRTAGHSLKAGQGVAGGTPYWTDAVAAPAADAAGALGAGSAEVAGLPCPVTPPACP